MDQQAEAYSCRESMPSAASAQERFTATIRPLGRCADSTVESAREMGHAANMKHVILIPVMSLTLAGCAGLDMNNIMPRPPHLQNQPATATSTPPAPPPDAVTVEQLDTASEADKVAAAATTPSVAAGSLGSTVASLGDPTTPGFWLETPLVKSETKGRVQSKSTGRTVKVTLRPASGGSSRVSLSTLQLLDLDISGLHELIVYGS